MVSTSRPRVVASGVAFLAVMGSWLAHTIEYARLSGTAGLAGGAVASMHAYMLPAGAALALGAALCGVWCARAWWALGRRLESARGALASAWRGRRPSGVPASPASPPSEGCRLVALWVPLAALQVSVYLLQENGEALLAGRALPALGAVTGLHATVLLIHAAVALLLAAVVLLVAERLHRRRSGLAACERLLRAVLRTLGRAVDTPAVRPAWTPSPLDRFGRHLCRRPPPRLLSAA
jgi:hypothetical protein